MMMDKTYDNPYDGYNWCRVSQNVFNLNKDYPWETRQNKAFFAGATTGKHRKHFGYMEHKSGDEENHPEYVE